MVIALDGQPVAPHIAGGGRIVLGPAMRVDLILDMTAPTGSRTTIVDRFYEGLEYGLTDILYADEPLRDDTPGWPVELPANPLGEPDLGQALRHEVALNGGMMGGMIMRELGGGTGDSGADAATGGG